MSYTSFVKIISKYFIFLALVNGTVFFGACVLKHYSVLLRGEEESRLIFTIPRLGGRGDSGATI